jgi:uncharacterized protein
MEKVSSSGLTQAEMVPIIQVVRDCSDPKDNKFLGVALNGSADVIITGDSICGR